MHQINYEIDIFCIFMYSMYNVKNLRKVKDKNTKGWNYSKNKNLRGVYVVYENAKIIMQENQENIVFYQLKMLLLCCSIWPS